MAGDASSTTAQYFFRRGIHIAGRLINVQKTLNDNVATTRFIVRNEYDELGQLKKKLLGQNQNNLTELEELNYEYNIRGWLKGVNKDYASANTNSRWFGMELSYDWGFNNNQFNGNIAGAKWRSKGDGEQRAFGYGYDAANRLLSADFTQNNGGWNQTAGLNFNVKMGDGINHTTAYDANGNIKGMQQWGLKLNSSVQIDNLSYTYNNSSNKLSAVTDAIVADQKLGDFTDKNTNGADYNYDLNGNLIQDKNKDISNITYNHLNLPYLITVTGKGTIQYIYDAAGNKLEKRTIETSPLSKTTKTTYINGYVYQNDSLQFISHEEGRIRYKQPSNEFVYDYFIKDHLGNTRMVLTEEQQVDAYPVASLEANTLNNEKIYYTIPDDAATRVKKDTIANYPTDSYTNPNDFIQKLNGNGTKVGTSITLKVMAGDSYNLRANSWYRLNGVSPGSPVPPLASIVSSLISGVSAASAGKATISSLGGGIIDPSVTNFLNTQTVTSGRPKAYLNWILLDEQLKYVGGGFEQVGGNEVFTTHTRTNLPVTKNGYLYIYVSNETPNVNVFFDNVQVTHVRGPLLEETHYYPFGLTMGGISSNAAGKLENKKKFNAGSELNNKEFSDGSGLDWYDTHFRSLDPQIGRWLQIDPKPTDFESPYAAMGNNPILNNDPLGDTIVITYNNYNKRTEVTYNGGVLSPRNGNKILKDDGSFSMTTTRDLNKLGSFDKDLKNRLETMENSKEVHYIEQTAIGETNHNSPESSAKDKNGIPTGSITKYNPWAKSNARGDKRDPKVGLAHELLGHGYDTDQGKSNYKTTINGIPLYEVSAVKVENKVRAKTGDPKKTTYGGQPIPANLLVEEKKKTP